MRSGLAVQRKGFASFPLVQVDEIQDRLLKLLDGVVDAAPEPSSAFVKVGDGNAISWLRYRKYWGSFERRFTSLGLQFERQRHSSNPAASQQHFLSPSKQRSSKSGGNGLGTQTHRSQLLTDHAYFGILGTCGQLNS